MDGSPGHTGDDVMGRHLHHSASARGEDPHCSTMCYVWDMARDITQRQLRNDSGEIMRGLDRGESFVVTRHGVPVGELVPLRRHRFVDADSTVAVFGGAPSVDLARLRADLDRVATPDTSPRA